MKSRTSGAATLATDATSFAHACDWNMPTCTEESQGLRCRDSVVHKGGFMAVRSTPDAENSIADAAQP